MMGSSHIQPTRPSTSIWNHCSSRPANSVCAISLGIYVVSGTELIVRDRWVGSSLSSAAKCLISITHPLGIVVTKAVGVTPVDGTAGEVAVVLTGSLGVEVETAGAIVVVGPPSAKVALSTGRARPTNAIAASNPFDRRAPATKNNTPRTTRPSWTTKDSSIGISTPASLKPPPTPPPTMHASAAVIHAPSPSRPDKSVSCIKRQRAREPPSAPMTNAISGLASSACRCQTATVWWLGRGIALEQRKLARGRSLCALAFRPGSEPSFQVRTITRLARHWRARSSARQELGVPFWAHAYRGKP